MKDLALVEEIRKEVRQYVEGIRRAKDLVSQRALEDSFVIWVFTQIRKARKRESAK